MSQKSDPIAFLRVLEDSLENDCKSPFAVILQSFGSHLAVIWQSFWILFAVIFQIFQSSVHLRKYAYSSPITYIYVGQNLNIAEDAYGYAKTEVYK